MRASRYFRCAVARPAPERLAPFPDWPDASSTSLCARLCAITAIAAIAATVASTSGFPCTGTLSNRPSHSGPLRPTRTLHHWLRRCVIPTLCLILGRSGCGRASAGTSRRKRPVGDG